MQFYFFLSTCFTEHVNLFCCGIHLQKKIQLSTKEVNDLLIFQDFFSFRKSCGSAILAGATRILPPVKNFIRRSQIFNLFFVHLVDLLLEPMVHLQSGKIKFSPFAPKETELQKKKKSVDEVLLDGKHPVGKSVKMAY